MIREVGKDELNDCVKVIKDSFITVANEFGFTVENAPRFTAFSTTEERLTDQLLNEHRIMYAYYIEENIIGYYSISKVDNSMCELNNLAVLPEYRHSGIGRELLDSSIENARKLGFDKMLVSIVEENKVIRSWYERNGFIHQGTKKFDFFPFTCGYLQKDIG